MSPISPKTLDRVRKLLRLGESPNENEAAEAAAQAADLMARHGIEAAHLALSEGEKFSAILEESIESGNKLVSWRSALIDGCAKSQGAECWTSTRRDPETHKATRHVIMCGSRSQIDGASYLYRALAGEVERLAESGWHIRGTGTVRRWKNAFRVGCATVIARRLIAQREATISEYTATAHTGSQALVHLRDQDRALRRHVAQKNLRSGGRSTVGSRDGYAAGKDAGRAVHIGGGKGLSAPARRLGSGQ